MLKGSRYMCSGGLGDMVLWNVGLFHTTCNTDLLKDSTEFNTVHSRNYGVYFFIVLYVVDPKA